MRRKKKNDAETDKGCRRIIRSQKQFYVQSKFYDCLKTQICQFEHRFCSVPLSRIKTSPMYSLEIVFVLLRPINFQFEKADRILWDTEKRKSETKGEDNKLRNKETEGSL